MFPQHQPIEDYFSKQIGGSHKNLSEAANEAAEGGSVSSTQSPVPLGTLYYPSLISLLSFFFQYNASKIHFSSFFYCP